MELPRRILHEGASAFERELLASASEDAPTPEFRARFANSLGIVSAVGLTAASAGASMKPQALGRLVWLKWLTVGLSLGLVGVGAASSVLNEKRPFTATHVVSASPRQATFRPSELVVQEAAKPTLAVVKPATVSRVDPASPVAPSTRSAAASAAPAVPALSITPLQTGRGLTPPALTASALREEMAALQNVRALLAGSNASAASIALDAYDTRYPTGELATEAQLLRVDALYARGEQRTARALARRLLDTQPDSPYANHLAFIANGTTAPNP